MSLLKLLTSADVLSAALPAFLSAVLTACLLGAYRHVAASVRQHKWWYAATVIGLAVCCYVIPKYSLRFDPLPLYTPLLCLLVAVAVVLLYPTLRANWKTRLLGVASLMLAVGLTATLLNDFYRYFPTLGSVIKLQAFGSGTDKKSVFTAPQQIGVSNQPTIEATLYTNSSLTGTVRRLDIPVPHSGFKARPAYAYVPPIANSNPSVKLPVLVLLPGYPSFRGAADWTEGLALKKTMDDFAASHHGIAPLVVAVDSTGSSSNDTECLDSKAGKAETYLTQDVPEYIKTTFAVSTGPRYWAIGGLSMGGMCAAMLTVRHPGQFGYFMDFGGEAGPEVGSKQVTIAKLFGGSEAAWRAAQPALVLHDETGPKPLGGYFVYAKGDSSAVNQAIDGLYTAAREKHLDVVKEGIGGHHTFEVFQTALHDSLPWVSNRLGSTDCAGQCPGL